MYRLVIYGLAALLALAILLSFFEILSYNPWHIAGTALYLSILSYFANRVFAKLANAVANPESAVITALILALIVGPLSVFDNLALVSFLAVAAMASKYVIAWQRRHIFNPAALAVFLSAVLLEQGASWWVGGEELMPAVLVFGFVLSRKIARGTMVWSFVGGYLVFFGLLNAGSFASIGQFANFAWGLLLFSPILFFAFVMLPEPRTSPVQNWARITYGIGTAALLVLYQQYLLVPYTFELALLSGNVFAFAVSRSVQTAMELQRREQIAPRIYSFWFRPAHAFSFIPGQFLEWTLHHANADSRGMRRYFTIASSPTEQEILLTTKIPEKASSFKKKLASLQRGDTAVASRIQGDFTLPSDENRKLVFIAGGVGITPFRSIAKYLIDTNSSRDTVLLYSANSPEEFVFSDIFSQVKGIKTVYAVADPNNAPSSWQGKKGLIDEAMIKRHVPDWQERLFYVSGPQPMVKAVEKTLAEMGADKQNIKRDYFPGYEEI